MGYRKYTTESYKDGKAVDRAGYIGLFWGILMGIGYWSELGWLGLIGMGFAGLVAGVIIGHIIVVFTD